MASNINRLPPFEKECALSTIYLQYSERDLCPLRRSSRTFCPEGVQPKDSSEEFTTLKEESLEDAVDKQVSQVAEFIFNEIELEHFPSLHAQVQSIPSKKSVDS